LANGLAAALGVSLVTAVVAHLANPGLDPVRELVSGLAAPSASVPWLMTASLVLLTGSLAVFALQSWRRSQVMAGLAAVAALGMAVAAVVPQACSTMRPDCADRINAMGFPNATWVHGLGATIGVGALVALVAVGPAIVGSPVAVRVAGSVLGVVGPLLTVYVMVRPATRVGGLLERILLVALAGTLLLLSQGLRLPEPVGSR